LAERPIGAFSAPGPRRRISYGSKSTRRALAVKRCSGQEAKSVAICPRVKNCRKPWSRSGSV